MRATGARIGFRGCSYRLACPQQHRDEHVRLDRTRIVVCFWYYGVRRCACDDQVIDQPSGQSVDALIAITVKAHLVLRPVTFRERSEWVFFLFLSFFLIREHLISWNGRTQSVSFHSSLCLGAIFFPSGRPYMEITKIRSSRKLTRRGIFDCCCFFQCWWWQAELVRLRGGGKAPAAVA